MDQITILRFISALALASLCGALYAAHDALRIYWQDHQAHPQPLAHGGRAAIRLAGVVLLSLACTRPGLGWIAALATPLALHLAFALPFQLLLNRDRERPWDYVGLSNLYDRTLTAHFGDYAGEVGATLMAGGLLLAVSLRLFNA